MSTLRYFFDCTKENTKELFQGLKIMEEGEKYTSKLGNYPCIYITLKEKGFTNITKIVFAFNGKEVKMEKF